jgi:hypothetical protein
MSGLLAIVLSFYVLCVCECEFVCVCVCNRKANCVPFPHLFVKLMEGAVIDLTGALFHTFIGHPPSIHTYTHTHQSCAARLLYLTGMRFVLSWQPTSH